MNATDRTRKFTMNISDTERAMLKVLASDDGLTASDWLRQVIRKAFAELPEVSQKPAKPRRG